MIRKSYTKMYLHVDRQKQNTLNVSTGQLYTKAVNIASKINYLFILLFFSCNIIMITNYYDQKFLRRCSWMPPRCKQLHADRQKQKKCIKLQQQNNFFAQRELLMSEKNKKKTVVAAVRRRRWSWWFVFLPFIHLQFQISVLEFQARIHEPKL